MYNLLIAILCSYHDSSLMNTSLNIVEVQQKNTNVDKINLHICLCNEKVQTRSV